MKRVTGYTLEGHGANGLIHLINSGSAAMDGTGEQTINGQPAIKPWWEITPDEAKKCLDATQWRPAAVGYFRGGGFSSDFLTKGGMPITMTRLNLVQGLGPVLQIAEGYTVELPSEVHDLLYKRTDPTWPTTWFAPRIPGEAPSRMFIGHEQLGSNHGALSYGNRCI